ncbi:hypothetical protein V6N12_044113 [Hibiscus sabdariffa]
MEVGIGRSLVLFFQHVSLTESLQYRHQDMYMLKINLVGVARQVLQSLISPDKLPHFLNMPIQDWFCSNLLHPGSSSILIGNTIVDTIQAMLALDREVRPRLIRRAQNKIVDALAGISHGQPISETIFETPLMW